MWFERKIGYSIKNSPYIDAIFDKMRNVIFSKNTSYIFIQLKEKLDIW